MHNTTELNKKMRLGEKADELLEAFDEIIENMKVDLYSQWKGDEFTNWETVYNELKAVERLEQKLRSAVLDGKLAAEDMKEAINE